MNRINNPRRAVARESAALVLVFGFLLAGFAGSAPAAVTHHFEGSFAGSEAPGGPVSPAIADATDDSSDPSSGDVYLAGPSRVVKLNPDGTYAGVEFEGSETPQGSLSLISATTVFGAIAVDGSAGPNSGDVYVTDLEHSVVDKFSESGTFICQITARPAASRSPEEEARECDGATGSATPAGSIEPAGIAVDPATGDVWVSDYSHGAIDEFNAAGEFVQQFEDVHLINPGSIALDAAGNLYAVNGTASFGANPTDNNVVAFHDGNFIRVLDQHEPISVAADPGGGHAYVFGKARNAIAEYEADGTLLDSFAPEDGQPQHELTGLSVSTDGHVYASEVFGGLVKFSPDIVTPTVTTEPVSELTETGATLNGQVDPDAAHGGGPVESCFFEYVTKEAFEAERFQGAHTAACVPATPISSTRAVSARVALNPSTAYVFRLSAANADGVPGLGEALPLSTVGPPVILGEEASPLGSAKATLSATVDAAGFTADCHLEYVEASAFEQSGYATAQSVPCQPGSILGTATAEPVSASVAGLSVGTTYHYRFVSVNSAGTGRGADQTFSTFGIQSFAAEVLDAEGNPETQAGAHPFEWRIGFKLNSTPVVSGAQQLESANANLREVQTELPPGLIASATALAACPRDRVSLDQCPSDTQVGEIEVDDSKSERFLAGLYNVVPPRGVPLELGAVIHNVGIVYIDGNVRTGGDYGATAKVISPQVDNIIGSRVSIWGVPFDPRHDAHRVCPIPGDEAAIGQGECAPTGPAIPLLTNPTSCPGSSLSALLHVDSWELPGQFVSASSRIPATTGCNRLEFAPGLEARPTTDAADAPSGLHVDIRVPQPRGGVGHDERQVLTVSADEGTFTLSFGGQTTGDLPFDASAAEVQAALEALPSLGAGAIAVEGGPANGGSAPQRLLFEGPLSDTDVEEVTVADGTEPLRISGAPGSATVRTADPGVPASAGAQELAPADLRDATVTLPPGLVVNPSSANGLGACTAAQIGLTSAPGATPVTYTPAAAECPAASQLGTVEVDTPLLGHPLPGSVYLAQPFENPFHSLLAIYITVDDPISGVVVKLAGQVKPDPGTGRLTSVVEESPQLPFEDFKLDFFDGAAAPLRTPSVCGSYETSSVLTPWSAPESGPPATPADHYEISAGAGGSACPHSAGAEPDSPSFEAGTEAPTAGAYSPFVLHLARADGSQEISSIETTLPGGLIGKLAGVAECSDAQLAAAAAHSGRDEQDSPSCPASSELGTVTVGAGAGPQPYYATGHAYLAGPYKGAPLSLAIITPAVAGPFDLGTVVVRTALRVNPETTQITAVSDEIPHILQGIPLDVRSVTVDLKRSDFTLNPTNCERKQITGSVGTVQGQSAAVQSSFQVGGCKGLGFAPKLKLSLKGSTKHAGHPALRAVLTYPKGSYANIARAQVNLPHSEFIDQGNLNKTCTRPVLMAGNCPASTVYGRAKAWTPLLAKPLEGPVYLVGGYGYKLPALVAELNGQIRVLLVGKVDSGPNHGIRNTFEAVPDAPVERFELNLKGGPKYSLLENSENLCASPQRAIADFTAQNGRVLDTHPMIANSCKAKKQQHHKGGKAHHHKGTKSGRGSGHH